MKKTATIRLTLSAHQLKHYKPRSTEYEIELQSNRNRLLKRNRLEL